MRAWKRTFISAFTAQVLSILGFSFALPFLPFFISELGVSGKGDQAFWAGVVGAAAGLTFALFAPIWGVLADRFGRKLMVVRSMFGGTGVLFLMSYVQSVNQLIVCRLLQGMFTGTMAASVALVASVVPAHRSGFSLGMMQTAVFIGSASGPFIGGVLADMFGYRFSFRLGGVLCLAAGLLVHFGAAENFIPPDKHSEQTDTSVRGMFLLKGFLIAVGIMFSVRMSNTLVNPSFPLIVKEILPSANNLNSITGSVMAGAALAGAFSAAILGFVGDKIGQKNVLVVCCIGACLSSLGHYVADGLHALVAARIFFGLSVAGMLPASNAMIHSIINPRALGKAYGISTALSMLGVAVGPLAGGYMARRAGLRFPFLIAAAAQLILAVFIVIFVANKRTSSAPRSLV